MTITHKARTHEYEIIIMVLFYDLVFESKSLLHHKLPSPIVNH